MNLGFEKGLQLVRAISHVDVPENTAVILGVPFPYLKPAIDMLLHVPNVSISAQDCHHTMEGAFTGDVSAYMLSTISCPNVIVGHSERRAYHGESNAMIAQKINQALKYNLKVIFCCGEPLEVRQAGKQNQYVSQQILESLFHLTPALMEHVTIAYEPIWAIGTGETATPDQAQAMHAHIRSFIGGKFGDKIQASTSILYGGSVKPNNANDLFALEDVDGALVGGASLDSDSFTSIIQAF